MSSYNKLTLAVLEELRTMLGEKNVITDPDKMQPYSHDEVTESRYHHMPEVVVFPETTEQTAAVVKLANRELIPVVPRGAGTGLACGTVPIYGGIILSLEKMNKILQIDPVNMFMIAQAGARTEEVQQTAAKHNLLYAGDPAARQIALSAAMSRPTPRQQRCKIRHFPSSCLSSGGGYSTGEITISASFKQEHHRLCLSNSHRFRRNPWRHYHRHPQTCAFAEAHHGSVGSISGC